MKWKIATIILAIILVWSWVIPTVQTIYWLYYQSASARVCWIDTDSDGIAETGVRGEPRLFWNWDNFSVGYGTKCN